MLGEVIEFRDRDIIEAKVTYEINPLSMELPASTAEVSIYTTNSDFNPFSDAIYFQALKINTPADLVEYVNGTEIYIGRFYINEWNNPSIGVIKFYLQDAIGSMDSIMFDGLFYEQPTNISTIVNVLNLQAPCDIVIDPAIYNVELKGYIPNGVSLRAALQQVCFAAGAYAKTQGIDHIFIKPARFADSGAVVIPAYYDNLSAIYDDINVRYSDIIVDDVITDLEKLDKQELTILPIVTGIELTAHYYVKSDEAEVISDSLLVPGDYKIVYEKPYGDVSVEGNVLALEYGTNSVSFNVPATTQVTITGYPYNDNTSKLIWVNPQSQQDYFEGALYDAITSKYDDPNCLYGRLYSVNVAPNKWNITDATLIGDNNGQIVLNQLIKYAQEVYKQTITALADKNIDLGMLYLVDSLYDKKIVAGAEQVTINLSGGNLKETRLIGIEKMNYL
ncbi:MAG TPA: hypothetical protein PK348_06680 [Spirochaetota bacterium]|nr:hypothetical protein [Spirochaetota bacterium]